MTRKLVRGFTLVELLVVIAIIGVLAGMLLPAVMNARESSRRVQCANNLKQLVLAMHTYESAYQVLPPAMNWSGQGEPYGAGLLPIGTIDRVALGYSPSGEVDRLHANWVMMLLPQLEQPALYESFDFDLPVDADINRGPRSTNLPVMLCPSDPYSSIPYDRGQLASNPGHLYARGNYAFNLGPNRACFSFQSGCVNGFHVDSPDLLNKHRKLWGSGIGGFNVPFKFSRFPNGLSNIVAIDEIRAGLSPIDPRGTWALGMPAGSITSVHAYGPNSRTTGDAINSCPSLQAQYTEVGLERLGMPCAQSGVPANFAATSRSLHPGLVHVANLDGSVTTFSDSVDLEVWIRRHARDNIRLDGLLQP